MKIIFEKVKDAHIELQNQPGILQPSLKEQYKLEIKDEELKKVVSELFLNGHYSEAVEAAYKYLNNLVKKSCGSDSVDGANVMRNAFTSKNPMLMINPGKTQSERDEQAGYMDIFAGCMTGIRNPRAHEHDWGDDERRARQLIQFADHLVERVRSSINIARKRE